MFLFFFFLFFLSAFVLHIRNEMKKKLGRHYNKKCAPVCYIIIYISCSGNLHPRVKTSRYLPGKTISAKHILASLKLATITSCCRPFPPHWHHTLAATSTPTPVPLTAAHIREARHPPLPNASLLYPVYTAAPPRPTVAKLPPPQDRLFSDTRNRRI